MDSRLLERCALTVMNYPHKCTPDDLHLHHLINYSKARGNKEVRKILKSMVEFQDGEPPHPKELTDWVCAGANVGRIADTKGAQCVLFQKKVKQYGYEYMSEYLAGLPWKYPKPELRLEALLA